MTARSIRAIQFFVESLASFSLVALRALNRLADHVHFPMGKFAFLAIITRSCSLEVLAHFSFVLGLIGFWFHCYVLLYEEVKYIFLIFSDRWTTNKHKLVKY